MNKYREDRFSENKQKIIAEEAQECLKGMSNNDRADLIGLISSLMIIEDYGKE